MASATWSTGELEFAKTFSTERYKLLELQPELEEALATGMPVELHIKGPRGSGDKEQSATLCTEKTTYMMRKAESSNTHLLLSAEEPRKTIAGQVDFAYELIRVAPRVGPVALLLQDRAFGENLCHVSTASVLEDPQCVASAGWTFSELAARIQASNEEIRAELARLGAFELGGRWLTVDEKLESDVIAQCISVVVETGMDAKKVSTRAVSNALEHRFGDFCISRVLDRYATQKTTRDDGDAIISLDASKVARFCAEEIFKQSTDPALDADEFLRSWELALPKGVSTSESALAGLALRLEEGSGGRQVYKYFPATRLPSDLKTCFAELFAARKQWKLADIEPYIAHLLGPSVKKADLLRRFTRSVRVSLSSDERVLTSR